MRAVGKLLALASGFLCPVRFGKPLPIGHVLPCERRAKALLAHVRQYGSLGFAAALCRPFAVQYEKFHDVLVAGGSRKHAQLRCRESVARCSLKLLQVQSRIVWPSRPSRVTGIFPALAPSPTDLYTNRSPSFGGNGRTNAGRHGRAVYCEFVLRSSKEKRSMEPRQLRLSGFTRLGACACE